MLKIKELNVGDEMIYVLPFSEHTGITEKLGCVAVVKIAKIRNEDVCECYFTNVISDNSGNRFYEYIQKSEQTANCSIKYLYRR